MLVLLHLDKGTPECEPDPDLMKLSAKYREKLVYCEPVVPLTSSPRLTKINWLHAHAWV